MAITHVSGSDTSAANSGQSTLAITTHTLGDVVMLGVYIGGGAGAHIASISGGGCTGWKAALASPYVGGGNTYEIWFGTVTSIVSNTNLTITFTSSVSSTTVELDSSQFTAGLGSGTVWAVDGTQAAGITTASGTACPYPKLTATAAGELYFGKGTVGSSTAGSGTTGTGTPASAVFLRDAFVDPYCYAIVPTAGAYQPIQNQTSSSQSTMVGALFTAATPSTTYTKTGGAARVGRGIGSKTRLHTATTYYVSTAGSDSNTGTSSAAPWATVGKVNATTLQPGDSVLFRGGDTFTGTMLYLQNSGTAGNLITVGSYGTGTATLSNGSNSTIYAYDTSHLTVQNLTVAGTSTAYDAVSVYADTACTDVTLSGLIVTGGYNGIAVGGASGGGFSTATVTGCTVSGAVNGMFVYGPTFTPATPNYAHTSLTITGCTAHDNPGDSAATGTNTGSGIIVSSTSGATVTRCTAYNNGASNSGTTGGPVGIWAYAATNVTVSECLSYNNTSGTVADGGGFDLDIDCSNSTIQYSLAYGNKGPGFLLYGQTSDTGHAGNTVRYCTSWGNATNTGLAYGEVAAYPGTSNDTVYGCTIVARDNAVTHPSALYVPTGTITGLTLRNNILVSQSGPVIFNADADTTSSVLCQGNDYYSTAAGPIASWGGTSYTSLAAWRAAVTGQEQVSGTNKGQTVNPGLVAVATAPTVTDPADRTQPATLKLASGSAMAGTGLDLASLFGTSTGTRDYYGTTLASPYSVGAAQYVPATYAKIGGGAARGTGVGSRTVTHPAVVTKTGGAASVRSGVAAHTTSHAATFTKTGKAAARVTGSGPETVTHPATVVKTGAAATQTAGITSRTVTHPAVVAKTARAATQHVAAGTHSVAHPAAVTKTGGASVLAAADAVLQRYPTGPVVFSDGFESGNFTAWSSCQWVGRNDTCQLYNGTSDYSATVVADGTRPQVARFEVRDGDVPPFGGNERAEIAAPPGTETIIGDERWLSFDLKFDTTFPVTTDWCVVHQWRTQGDDTGSGPVTLAADPDDHLYLENPNPAPEWTHLDAGPVVRGTWRHYVLHVKFSTDKTVGFVELSIDGTVVVPQTYCETIRPGFDAADYLKFGIYRSNAETATAITYLDNVSLSTAPPSVTHTQTGGAAAAAAGTGAATAIPAAVHVEVGGAAATAAGSGASTVAHPAVHTSSGGAVMVAAGSGSHADQHPAVTSKAGAAAPVTTGSAAGIVTHPAVTTKTGAAAVSAVGSGPDLDQHPTVPTVTGGAAAAGAGAGLVVVDTASSTSKTGAAATHSVGDGALSVTHPAVTAKAGAAATVAAASATTHVTPAVVTVKTGGAAPIGLGVGHEAVTSASGIVKTGAAGTTPAGSGAQAVGHAVTVAKTGAAAAAAAASGAVELAPPVVHIKTAGAAARTVGSGVKLDSPAGTHAESGAAAAHAVAAGARTVTHPAAVVKSGGAGILVTPAGIYTVTGATTRAKTGAAAAAVVGDGHRPAVTVKTGGAAGWAAGTGLFRAPLSGWPPTITGPTPTPLLGFTGPAAAPLHATAGPVPAPLSACTGPAAAPLHSTAGPAAAPLIAVT